MKQIGLIFIYFFFASGCNKTVTPSGESTGIVDLSFETGMGFDNHVNSIALQSDGKLVVGGSFGSFNGISHPVLVRLDRNGTFDQTFFKSGNTFSTGSTATMVIQPDGKILFGGFFGDFNGTSISGIGRLNSDGSLDPSFNPGTGFSHDIGTVVLQPVGKIIVGGWFHTFNGINSGRIVRLNNNGTFDQTFKSGSWIGAIVAIAIQPDGKIIIAGTKDDPPGNFRNSLTRVNYDGSPDTTFKRPEMSGFSISTIALQPDSKIIVGGTFDTINGIPYNGIVRFKNDGNVDPTFNPGTGLGDINKPGLYPTARCITLQPDGKILIGGYFTTFNGISRNSIVRLNKDGSLDSTFDPGSGFSFVFYQGSYPIVSSIVLQADGNIIVGGAFDTYNGTRQNFITRLK